MAKCFGKIVYLIEEETSPGIWKPSEKSRDFYGDLISNGRRRTSNESSINDDIVMSNSISIIADPFAIENCARIAYVMFRGNAWKVTSVDIQYPRLILTLGGTYNGKQA